MCTEESHDFLLNMGQVNKKIGYVLDVYPEYQLVTNFFLSFFLS